MEREEEDNKERQGRQKEREREQDGLRDNRREKWKGRKGDSEREVLGEIARGVGDWG